MADQTHPTKDSLTQKFNVNEDVPDRESLSGNDTDAASKARPQRASANRQASGQQDQADQAQQQPMQASGDALDVLRGSVVGVLESVVREYEPQIAEFTSSIAHQAVDRGVDFAQGAVQRAKGQSWLRIGLAAALGIGMIAVLTYEVEQAQAAPTKRKPLH